LALLAGAFVKFKVFGGAVSGIGEVICQ